MQKLWINLWKNRWEDCGLAVNKTVDKQNFGHFYYKLLWICSRSSGLNTENCENRRCYSGKVLQINKLYKSEISTTST